MLESPLVNSAESTSTNSVKMLRYPDAHLRPALGEVKIGFWGRHMQTLSLKPEEDQRNKTVKNCSATIRCK